MRTCFVRAHDMCERVLAVRTAELNRFEGDYIFRPLKWKNVARLR